METERAFIVRNTDGRVVAHVYRFSGQDTRRRTSYYTCGTNEAAKTLIKFLLLTVCQKCD